MSGIELHILLAYKGIATVPREVTGLITGYAAHTVEGERVSDRPNMNWTKTSDYLLEIPVPEEAYSVTVFIEPFGTQREVEDDDDYV